MAFAVGARTGVRRTLTPRLVTAWSSSLECYPGRGSRIDTNGRRQCIPELQEGPFPARMSGHIVMENSTRSQFQDHEYVKDTETGRNHDEEIARHGQRCLGSGVRAGPPRGRFDV